MKLETSPGWSIKSCKELVATLILDHWHAHARPGGGFDPESDLCTSASADQTAPFPGVDGSDLERGAQVPPEADHPVERGRPCLRIDPGHSRACT